MKAWVYVAAMMFCVATMGRTQATLDGAANSAFAGTWDGEQMNGLPSLDIKIENAGGKLVESRSSICKNARIQRSRGM